MGCDMLPSRGCSGTWDDLGYGILEYGMNLWGVGMAFCRVWHAVGFCVACCTAHHSVGVSKA